MAGYARALTRSSKKLGLVGVGAFGAAAAVIGLGSGTASADVDEVGPSPVVTSRQASENSVIRINDYGVARGISEARLGDAGLDPESTEDAGQHQRDRGDGEHLPPHRPVGQRHPGRTVGGLHRRCTLSAARAQITDRSSFIRLPADFARGGLAYQAWQLDEYASRAPRIPQFPLSAAARQTPLAPGRFVLANPGGPAGGQPTGVLCRPATPATLAR